MKQKQNKKTQKSQSKKKQTQPRGAVNSVPAAYSTDGNTSQAKVQRGLQNVIITHREFIGNVEGSVNWAIVRSFALNPGLSPTFPWLSIQAQGWERYRFRRLQFRYLTRCGTNTAGSINLIPEYNPTVGGPISEEVACSYQNALEGSAWRDHLCVLNMKSMNAAAPGGKFIRSTTLPEGEDLGLYDSGNLFVGTSDATGGALNFGKLWVEYEVELLTPQMRPGGYVYPLVSIYQSTSNTGSILNTGVNSQCPDGQELPISIAGNLVTFNRGGKYLISRRIFRNTSEPGYVLAPVDPVVGNGLLMLNLGIPTTRMDSIDVQQGVYRDWIVNTPEKGTFLFGDTYTNLMSGTDLQFQSLLRVFCVNPSLKGGFGTVNPL